MATLIDSSQDSAARDSRPAVPTAAERDANRIRFETELEFVQCLANPFYLQSLAQQGLFEQPAFLNYLQYLRYFRDPRYARFLQYPSSLEHLALLTAPDPAGQLFRTTLRDQPLMAQEWAGKMVARWAGWRERDVVAGGRNRRPERRRMTSSGVTPRRTAWRTAAAPNRPCLACGAIRELDLDALASAGEVG